MNEAASHGNGGGTVLQRLLAERYSNENSTPSGNLALEALKSAAQPPLSVDEVHLYEEFAEPADAANSRAGESDPAARLDALCLSTLRHPKEPSAYIQHAGQSGASDDVSAARSDHRKVAIQLSRAEMQKRNKSDPGKSESLVRRPPPSYAEARLEIGHVSAEDPERSYSGGVPHILSPRYHMTASVVSTDNSKQAKGKKRHDESGSALDTTSNARAHLNGHLKSSSGGDEHLYTDSSNAADSSRLVQLRGIRSDRKAALPVARSSSLHQNPVDKASPMVHPRSNWSPPFDERRLSNSSASLSQTLSSNHVHGSAQKHGASVSNPSPGPRKPGAKEQRRYSAHSSPFLGQTSRSSEELGSNPGYVQTKSRDSNCSEQLQQSNSLASIMPQTPTTGQSGYMRTPSTPSMHSHYYPSVAMHSSPGQQPTMSTATHQQIINAKSPPRRPPPPYPAGMMGLEKSHLSQQSDEGSSWQPQRPNSLALGQSGKKRNGCGSALNSPTVTSPTTVPSTFPGTPMRGTPFYSASKDSPYTMAGFQQQPPPQQQQSAYQGSIAPSTATQVHQRQTSGGNGSGQYFKRTNSGRNVLVQGASSSSSSSTVTAVSTPNYQELPNFQDVRSPVNHTPTTYPIQGGYPQDAFTPVTNGSVTKSDSMNSGTSSVTSSGGASRIARRRKRNSSSKGSSYPTNTSGSGSSSSNSGSRPNSNADLTDRLELENENLSNQLQTTLLKLKRFESIEVDLQRITEDHLVLHQSVNKREKLEVEMRNELSAQIQNLKQENRSMEEHVARMTEDLKSVSISSLKDDEVKQRNVMELIEAQNRKFAERERQLQEELEECRERLAEQDAEIEQLNSSLDKSNAAIRCFKAKFLQSSQVDKYTEQLPDQLAALQRIVEERHQIEAELRDKHRRQLLQRPLKSTSSNDEGISEMDSSDLSNASVLEWPNNRESQMLGVKAEMLKWRHMYLEQGLLHHVQASSPFLQASHPAKICRAIRSHRHAISDPGFDKITINQCLLPQSAANGLLRKAAQPDADRNASFEKPAAVSPDSATAIFQGPETPGSVRAPSDLLRAAKGSMERIDSACQTPDGEWAVDSRARAPPVQCYRESNAQHSSANKQTRSNEAAMKSGGVAETPQPEEGYHSQQSSGSPTPNTERSSVHFPAPGDFPASVGCETHSAAIRRNRSADVLTSLNV